MVHKSFMVSSYLAEQQQYLLLPKDNRFRSDGVLFYFVCLFVFSCWSVGRSQQPLPRSPVLSVLRL